MHPPIYHEDPAKIAARYPVCPVTYSVVLLALDSNDVHLERSLDVVVVVVGVVVERSIQWLRSAAVAEEDRSLRVVSSNEAEMYCFVNHCRRCEAPRVEYWESFVHHHEEGFHLVTPPNAVDVQDLANSATQSILRTSDSH